MYGAIFFAVLRCSEVHLSDLFTSGMKIFTTTFSNLHRVRCVPPRQKQEVLVGLSISKADVIVGN